MATLHVFVDESGDLHFTPSASRFLILASAWTYDPRPLADHLTSLRVSLLKKGHDVEYFHAVDDHKKNRPDVVSIMSAHREWWFVAKVIEKPKVSPEWYHPSAFYPHFLPSLLRFIIRGRMKRDTDMILIYTDWLPGKPKDVAVTKAVKGWCGAELRSLGVRYRVFHHPICSNNWLEVADYCAWAVGRKWEQGKHDFYDPIRPRLAASERNQQATETQIYYAHRTLTAPSN